MTLLRCSMLMVVSLDLGWSFVLKVNRLTSIEGRRKAMKNEAWAVRPSAPAQWQVTHTAGTHPHRIWSKAAFFFCGKLFSSIEITANLRDIWINQRERSTRWRVKAIIESDPSPKMVAKVRQIFPACS